MRFPPTHGLAAAVILLAGCGSEARIEPLARPAIVERARPANVVVTESYAGEVRARYESMLGFRIAGKILERRVDSGSQVRRGDVLATLEAQDLKLKVDADAAAVAAAVADASLAKAELERHAELLEKKYISQASYDARLNTFKAAQARQAQAQAQLAVARNQSTYTTLRADADAVVTSIRAEVGQVVGAGTPVVGLAHDGDMDVLIAVPESRVGLFRISMPVVVEVWASNNARFAGTVREVSPEADPQARTYAVRVTFSEPAEVVHLGMTARVYVDAGDTPPTLLLPLSALHEKAGMPAVWLVDPASSKVRLVNVELGSYREEGVALLGGIDADDWVVTVGVHMLSEGQTVRPIDRANRSVSL